MRAALPLDGDVHVLLAIHHRLVQECWTLVHEGHLARLALDASGVVKAVADPDKVVDIQVLAAFAALKAQLVVGLVARRQHIIAQGRVDEGVALGACQRGVRCSG